MLMECRRTVVSESEFIQNAGKGLGLQLLLMHDERSTFAHGEVRVPPTPPPTPVAAEEAPGDAVVAEVWVGCSPGGTVPLGSDKLR